MHDIQRAHEIVKVALAAARERGAERIERIDLTIGELSLLDPDQVRFWVGELLRGTIGEGAQVVVQTRPAHLHCRACDYRGQVQVEDDPIYHLTTLVPSCPRCGASDVDLLSGNECIVESLSIEAPSGSGGR